MCRLKDIPGECDLLIFDDMRFDSKGLDLTPEQMICLLDAKRVGSIKCRHYDGLVPCIPRIFTTNLDIALGETIFPLGDTAEQIRAMRRRMRLLPFLNFQLFVVEPEDYETGDDEEDTSWHPWTSKGPKEVPPQAAVDTPLP